MKIRAINPFYDIQANKTRKPKEEWEVDSSRANYLVNLMKLAEPVIEQKKQKG